MAYFLLQINYVKNVQVAKAQNNLTLIKINVYHVIVTAQNAIMLMINIIV